MIPYLDCRGLFHKRQCSGSMVSKTTNESENSHRLRVTSRVSVPLDEFSFTFSRSSGPGGQNVNKVNTKVRLLWNIGETESLAAGVKDRFIAKCKRRINSDGVFQITSQRFRDQERNRADCLEKLRGLLLEAAVPPKPRKKTKPSRRAIERRLENKRQRSSRKQSRRRVERDD